MNFLNKTVSCFSILALAAILLVTPTFAQQTVDPTGACAVLSTASLITAQTGTFYCVPNSVGAALGTWTNVGPAINGVRVARAKYDFAVDGGAIAAITPATNMIIPANAIIFGSIINSTTAFTSGGSATFAVGTTAGSSASSLKAATAYTSFSANALVAGVPVFTAASAVKMSAAGAINVTIAVATITAGVAEIFCFYVVPSA